MEEEKKKQKEKVIARKAKHKTNKAKDMIIKVIQQSDKKNSKIVSKKKE